MPKVSELQQDPSKISPLIEHTNVNPASPKEDIRDLCKEVIDYDFHGAVVVPYHAEFAAELLGDQAEVIPVIGFPYGIQNPQAKQAEIEPVLEVADELDMVINRTAFANGDDDAVINDIRGITERVDDLPVKCIIEAGDLTDEEVHRAARLVERGGADFVKTAVGYGGPVSPEDVRIIDEAVSEDIGIKASAGYDDYTDVLEMVEAGASRIGTSVGDEIMDSIPN